MRRIAPLYIPTSEPSRWNNALGRLGQTDVLIFNPASGPGAAVDVQWQARAVQARGRGLAVAGYTPVDYGRRAVEAMKQLDNWRLWYQVRSVFLDEFPADVEQHGVPVTFLEALILLARRVATPGGSSSSSNSRRVILNPGTIPTRLLVDALPDACWIVHEGVDPNGPSVDDIGRPPVSYIPAMQQGWLSYNDPDPDRTMARLAELGWGLGYSTSDPGPRGNPWDADSTT